MCVCWGGLRGECILCVVCRHYLLHVDAVCQLYTLSACCRREKTMIRKRAEGPLHQKSPTPMFTRGGKPVYRLSTQKFVSTFCYKVDAAGGGGKVQMNYPKNAVQKNAKKCKKNATIKMQ